MSQKYTSTMDDQNNSNAIDPVVQSLLPNYIKSRRLEIFQLQRLLAENSFDKIRIIGHNLRGSGGLYGLQTISDIGQEIEDCALVSDHQGLGAAIKNLHDFLNNIAP